MVSATEALQLVEHGQSRWVLPVTARLCAGNGRVFGGVLAAAAGAVAEMVTPERPLAVLSTDFLASTGVGDELVLAHRMRTAGRSATTSEVIGTVGEQLVFEASCLQLPRSTRADRPATTGPVSDRAASYAVRPPESCPLRPYRWPDPSAISSWLEVRVASDRDDGHALLWVRLANVERQEGALLALAADHVAFVGGTMLGSGAPWRTLQQTLRFCGSPGSRSAWVLVEVAVTAVDGDVAHGETRISTQEGSLVALSEQTLLLAAPRKGRNP
jgi:acyl-CoA thioesterase